MEQKKTQRIIGIVIVIALVIIIYPLIFSNSATSPKVVASSTVTQSVPLPVEQQSLTTAAIQQPVTESEAQPKPIINAVEQISTPIDRSQAEEENKTAQPFTPVRVQPTVLPGVDQPSQPSTPTNIINVNPHKFHPLPPKKMVSASAKKVKSPTEQDLLKLKRIAWAVQMGSFKNKENATRLTDKLRAAGYKAFTRQIEAKLGTQTRVYVGPEFKQMAAVKLSSKIEHDLKLHGIVIAYQPLTL